MITVYIEDVPVVRSEDDTYYKACPRCTEEQGRISAYRYVDGGICFKCAGVGHGSKLGSREDAERYVHNLRRDRESRKRSSRDKKERLDAEIAAFWADHDDTFDGLMEMSLAGNGLASDLLHKHYVPTEKQLALADRIVSEYRIRKANKEKLIATAKHLGEVGEKITVEITITTIRLINGAYGSSLLIVGKDADGNVVKTFTTAAWSDDVEEGQTVTINGTVKSHDTYQDIPQTNLTRTKRV